MSHYDEYYEDLALEARNERRKELHDALTVLSSLTKYIYDKEVPYSQYVLPSDVRDRLNEHVIRYIKSELYSQ